MQCTHGRPLLFLTWESSFTDRCIKALKDIHYRFHFIQVHALHHKSYNPTAFSGTNMHPVEATLYYSAAFIPVALGLHPVSLQLLLSFRTFRNQYENSFLSLLSISTDPQYKVHALAVIIDCAMGAWLGHDGFQWPGSGDYFHMLHHKVFHLPPYTSITYMLPYTSICFITRHSSVCILIFPNNICQIL